MKNNNPKGIIYILIGMFIFFGARFGIMKYIFNSTSLYEGLFNKNFN